jgi:hypothetical protein
MWAKPAGVMLPISVMVRAGDRCKARFAAKARRPRLPRPFWRALSGLDFAAVSVSVPALASAFISRTRQKIESMSGPSRWAAANCPAQSDHFSSAMRWLGHHRLRDRKLLGRFTMLPVRITASRTFNCSLCRLLIVSPVSYECIFRFLLLRWICHANLCIQYLFLWNWANSRALPRRQVGA